MRVKKRGDRGYEDVKFDKITARIDALVREGGYGTTVNSTSLALSTIKNLYDGISTEELDYIAASIAESRKLIHPDYAGLAGRIMISNLHKSTPSSFSQCMIELDMRLGNLSERHLLFIRDNAQALDAMIDHSADYKFNYIAYRALEKQYLHSVKVPELDATGQPIYVDFDGEVCTDTSVMRKPKTRRRLYDRPQYMFMRVAIEIALAGDISTREETLKMVREYYVRLSEMRFIYATPTNFNACTKFPQLNSCFLLNTADSIEEIMRTVTNSALISKRAGGIGIAYHKIRCRGSEIKGTNGESSGIVQQLKIFNEDARCWNQGGGKRPGAFAIYLEVWHGDIMQFLRLKITQGADTERARDLFYALWVCDLFMIRSRTNTPWSLFSEDMAPGLSEVFDGMRVCAHCGHCDNINYNDLTARGVLQHSDVGLAGDGPLKPDPTCQHSYMYRDVFTNLYTRYENEGRAVRRILPSVIIDAICEAQRDQGVPFICYKDHANRQTNQLNIGTLQSSNLCVAPETYVLTDKGQYPIANLVNTDCNVWNGKEFSRVRVLKTGVNQKLIRVNLSNGVNIDCTEYHKFHLMTGSRHNSFTSRDAKDLKTDDPLIKYELPIIASGERIPHPYTHGLFCADGTYLVKKEAESACEYAATAGEAYCARHIGHKSDADIATVKCSATSNAKIPKLFLYGEKKALLPYINYRGEPTENAGRIELLLNYDIAEKYKVPINAHIDDKIDWFAGLCDGDGTVARNGTNLSVQVGSIDKDFLLQVRLMLQTIGVDSKVTLGNKAGKRQMPDGKGGSAEYDCKDLYRLLVSSVELTKLQELGFIPHRLKLDEQKPQRSASQFIKVVSIEDLGRNSDTYCFTEPKVGRGMFNGVLTGQCTEIYEWHSKDEYACCSLASINLKNYVLPAGSVASNATTDLKTLLSRFDFARMHSDVKLVARGLDRIISYNQYPVPECEVNARRFRPIGIGVQGLANVFMELRIPFISPEAERLDLEIFETLYHAALEASCDLASELGPHDKFEGSPLSNGVLRMDLWLQNQERMKFVNNGLIDLMSGYGFNGRYDMHIDATSNVRPQAYGHTYRGSAVLSGRYDWDAMRFRVQRGVRNSLLIAPMPTVTTSVLLGNYESFEPMPMNIYTKSVISGKFTECNDYMVKHLTELGLWNDVMKNRVIANNGSLAGIAEIPKYVQEIYSPVWDMKQTAIMRRAALRHVFVDQGQSLNIHLSDNSNGYLRGVLNVGWELGNNTGSYYIRTPPAGDPLKNNIAEVRNQNMPAPRQWNVIAEEGPVCTPGCDSCSS